MRHLCTPLGCLLVSVLSGGCESEKSAQVTEIDQALINAPADPAPAESRQKQEEVRRPRNRAELMLNAARRAKLETAVPEAKGFLDVLSLEQGLFKKNLTRGKVDAAIRRFDAAAKNHWVLFVGNIGKQEGSAFELAVRYTPRDPKDPFGLTSNWFPVHFDGVEGYDPKDYRPGQLITVLAHYDGGQKVSKARDVVMQKLWDFDSVE